MKKQYNFSCHISFSFLMTKNVSDKICEENKNKHFVFNNFFFRKNFFNEIMWRNIVECLKKKLKVACGAFRHCSL